MKVGLNLYSIRKFIQTEEDFLQTALKLKEMGYDFIQFSGATFEPEMIKRVSEKSALPVVLTHIPENRLFDETKSIMDGHKYIGCKNIGLGGIKASLASNESAIKEKVNSLNELGKVFSENGFKFFYHTHHFDFFKHNGKTNLDYMLENAPYVNFTADIYWLQYGGVSITEYLEKMKGRVDCVHLKDYKLLWHEERYIPSYCALGDGTINFKSVIKACKNAKVKQFIVEQDNAGDYENPFEEVKKSVDFLKNNF